MLRSFFQVQQSYYLATYMLTPVLFRLDFWIVVTTHPYSTFSGGSIVLLLTTSFIRQRPDTDSDTLNALEG